MNWVFIVWLVTAFVAIACISHLMRNRQAALTQLLERFVTEQREFARKKRQRREIALKASAENVARAATTEAQPTQNSLNAKQEAKTRQNRESSSTT